MSGRSSHCWGRRGSRKYGVFWIGIRDLVFTRFIRLWRRGSVKIRNMFIYFFSCAAYSRRAQSLHRESVYNRCIQQAYIRRIMYTSDRTVYILYRPYSIYPRTYILTKAEQVNNSCVGDLSASPRGTGGGVMGGSGPQFCSDPSWDKRKSVEKLFYIYGVPMYVYCYFHCSPAKKHGSDPHFFGAGDATAS